MNPPPEGAYDDTSSYRTRADVDVVVFPSLLDIKDCLKAKLLAGPQYAHPEAPGAHTGDVSMTMIATLGCRYVLCGHSERRFGHRETNEEVTAQVIAALELGMHPVLCVGESAAERKAGKEKTVVQHQLSGMPLLSDMTIAYEPVWAIGTGKTPSPEDAESMHAHLRSLLPQERRETTRILYGGSMNAENAEAFLHQPDIDGGLIGGASLKPDEFRKIVEIAAQTAGH